MNLFFLVAKGKVKVVSSRFYINNPIDNEDFGVIMVLKEDSTKKF